MKVIKSEGMWLNVREGKLYYCDGRKWIPVIEKDTPHFCTELSKSKDLKD